VAQALLVLQQGWAREVQRLVGRRQDHCSSRADDIYARASADHVNARGGKDLVLGGSGDDDPNAGGGLEGGAGDDTVRG
jgi:hypothetical protein